MRWGLIGSEHNGLGVVNQTARYVVTDRVCCAGSGWFGATDTQTALFDQVGQMTDDMFIDWVKDTPNFRGNHTLLAD